MGKDNGVQSLFGCFGIIIFIVGVVLTCTGVGAVAGVPIIVFMLIGSKLIDKAR
jgi:hypothetical protein